MTNLSLAVLALGAAVAGGINSVAGGGSFLSFPLLIFYGLSPITANATSTFALIPGSFAGAWAYRKELVDLEEFDLKRFLWISLVGGLLGAVLLIKTPPTAFDRIVPFLLLFATFVFIGGPVVNRRLLARARNHDPKRMSAKLLWAQLAVAIYGGYFGGGVGILMLAMMTLLGMKRIHGMNAAKTLLSGSMNAIAVTVFIAMRAIAWREALVMASAATAGGYGGALIAQRISPLWLRRVIGAYAIGMTLYFFVHEYLHRH